MPARRGMELRGIEERQPARRVLERHSVYRRLLAMSDLLCAAAALAVAVNLLGDTALRTGALLALPVVVLVAKLQGLYDRDNLLVNKTTLDEAPRVFQAATLYTLLCVIAEASLVRGTLAMSQVVALWATLFAAGILGRWTVRRVARGAIGPERVLVLGEIAEAEMLRSKLEPASATVVAGAPLGVAGPKLREHVVEHQIHRIIVAPGDAAYDETVEGIRVAKAVGLPVSVLPRLLEVVGSSVVFDQLHGISLLGVRHFGLTRSSQVLKGATDRLAAAAGLVLVAPLLAVLALVVRLGSPGPVLFRQQRIGRDGTPFELLKFRTMVADAEAQRAALEAVNEADGLFKIAADPRVTRPGRWMRRASLDELPQLVNVLRGEMSLVGPRPLVPEEDRRIEGLHRRRLHLKPGMTGQWQISGSSKIPLREMVVIDYLYAANWSLWGDIKILCRTLPYMAARRGL